MFLLSLHACAHTNHLFIHASELKSERSGCYALHPATSFSHLLHVGTRFSKPPAGCRRVQNGYGLVLETQIMWQTLAEEQLSKIGFNLSVSVSSWVQTCRDSQLVETFLMCVRCTEERSRSSWCRVLCHNTFHLSRAFQELQRVGPESAAEHMSVNLRGTAGGWIIPHPMKTGVITGP